MHEPAGFFCQEYDTINLQNGHMDIYVNPVHWSWWRDSKRPRSNGPISATSQREAVRMAVAGTERCLQPEKPWRQPIGSWHATAARQPHLHISLQLKPPFSIIIAKTTPESPRICALEGPKSQWEMATAMLQHRRTFLAAAERRPQKNCL